jgi:hypothetical protein
MKTREPENSTYTLCSLSESHLSLEVSECPFCGCKHAHGAGDPRHNPWPILGPRVPHCDGEPPRSSYVLTMRPEELERAKALQADLARVAEVRDARRRGMK